jgi:hypothetical protein
MNDDGYEYGFGGNPAASQKGNCIAGNECCEVVGGNVYGFINSNGDGIVGVFGIEFNAINACCAFIIIAVVEGEKDFAAERIFSIVKFDEVIL